MSLRRMPLYLIEWVKDFTENRYLSFSFDGKTEPPQPFRNAIPQGSPVSPILFSVMMCAIIEDSRRKALFPEHLIIPDEYPPSEIQPSRQIKLLGVIIDKTLSLMLNKPQKKDCKHGQSIP
jgi:hypothetical protein